MKTILLIHKWYKSIHRYTNKTKFTLTTFKNKIENNRQKVSSFIYVCIKVSVTEVD